MILKYEYDVIN